MASHLPELDLAINTGLRKGRQYSLTSEVVDCKGSRGRVFQSAKTGEPLENGRHWFDDAVIMAEIKSFRWHDLRHTFASRLR